MLAIIIIASLMGILSGCSKLFAGGASEFVNSRTRQLDRETDRDKKHFVEVLDNIFKAMDNKDKEGLKKLFAENVIKENPNFAKQIDDLFFFIKGLMKVMKDWLWVIQKAMIME
jgi:flagellar motor switch protein FliG